MVDHILKKSGDLVLRYMVFSLEMKQLQSFPLHLLSKHDDLELAMARRGAPFDGSIPQSRKIYCLNTIYKKTFDILRLSFGSPEPYPFV